MEKLDTKLEKIVKVFNIDEIFSIKRDNEYVAHYYKINQLAYSLLHTINDRMYMGISRDGKYKPEDLLEAARTVEFYIEETDAKRVLELATGRGANSYYLAKRHPKIMFSGLDISQGQLAFAKKKSRRANNYKPKYGDYHELNKIKDSSVDICFVVEALCYSTNKARVLDEVMRVLKDNGKFIIFDGYFAKPREVLKENEQLACRLTEVGMALDEFEEYASFKETIKKKGIRIVHEEDVSQYIVPTLNRFEKLARYFFKFPLLARLLSKFLAKEFLYNALSGYLMPNLIKRDVASYMITVLEK